MLRDHRSLFWLAVVGLASPAGYPGSADAQCEFTEQAKLLAADGAAFDLFGNGVDLDVDRAIVGASGKDCSAGSNCGAAYIYRWDGAAWTLEAELTAPDAVAFHGFGRAVGIDGDLAVVGAEGDSEQAEHAGAAYIFRREAAGWVLEAKLTAPDGEAEGRFGGAVSLEADRVLIGARFDDFPEPFTIDDGSAYVFRREGTDWALEAKLFPPQRCDGRIFGGAVSLTADRALIGAPGDQCGVNSNGAVAVSGGGVAFVFRRTQTSWEYEAALVHPDWPLGGFLATSVSLSGDVALAPNSDRAYFFRRNGTTWALESIVTPPDGNGTGAFRVSVSGESAVLGAPFADPGGVSSAGVAYVYTFGGGGWALRAQLTASDAASGDGLGSEAALDAGRVLLGAPSRDESGGQNVGAAYTFDLPAGCADCNTNGVPDSQDIADGVSQDIDGNGIPDDCCGIAQSPLAQDGAVARNRYVGLVPQNAGRPTALRVRLASLNHPDPPATADPTDFSAFQGQFRWVGPPARFTDSTAGSTWAAALQCEPHVLDWAAVSPLYLYGDAIVPDSVYEVQAIEEGCLPGSEASFSPPLSLRTARWGDVAPPFQPTCAEAGCTPCTTACATQPNAIDIASLVDAYKGLPGAISKLSAQLQPHSANPGGALSALDVTSAVNAFKGFVYAYSGLTPCAP